MSNERKFLPGVTEAISMSWRVSKHYMERPTNMSLRSHRLPSPTSSPPPTSPQALRRLKVFPCPPRVSSSHGHYCCDPWRSFFKSNIQYPVLCFQMFANSGLTLRSCIWPSLQCQQVKRHYLNLCSSHALGNASFLFSGNCSDSLKITGFSGTSSPELCGDLTGQHGET